MSRNLQGQGNTITHIGLGCWPVGFFFPAPWETLTLQTTPPHPEQANKNRKSKYKIKRPRQNVRVFLFCCCCCYCFLQVLRIFSREASWCGTRKLLAASPFLTMQGEPGWVEKHLPRSGDFPEGCRPDAGTGGIRTAQGAGLTAITKCP